VFEEEHLHLETAWELVFDAMGWSMTWELRWAFEAFYKCEEL
jgi:hypothetical protein